MKTCSTCRESLTVEAFSKKAANADGLQHVCKGCQRAYTRQHYLENREKRQEQQRSWRIANPGYDEEGQRARAARRRQLKADKVNANIAARKGYVKRATPPWANLFFIAEAYHIAKVREKMLGGKWHVDHVIPLRGKTVCGLHVENNLQVIPAKVNLKKHATFET